MDSTVHCRVSSAVLLTVPLQAFCSLLIPSINVTWSSNWFLIAIWHFPIKIEFFNVSDIPVTNIFCWSLSVSLLPTEKLEKDPGIQELKLHGSWGKVHLLSFWAITRSAGAAIQNASSKRQGSATRAIPASRKADALPLAPMQSRCWQ